MIVVAIDGERWVGMVAVPAARRPQHLADARCGSTRRVRGTGLGARLIEAVADWAREQGAATVELSVTTNNDAAATLYARAGFAETGPAAPAADRPVAHRGVPQPAGTALSTSGPWRRGLPSAGSSETEMPV